MPLGRRHNVDHTCLVSTAHNLRLLAEAANEAGKRSPADPGPDTNPSRIGWLTRRLEAWREPHEDRTSLAHPRR